MTIHTEMWRSNADQTSVQVALTQRLWDELRREPGLDTTDLTADVTDFVATLGGAVPRLPDKLVAERAAKRVPGIQAVVNRVEVTPPPSSERSDTDLTRIATYALEWNTLVPAGRVQASASRGWVTLEGDVDADYERAAAEETIQRLAGVRGITSRIIVAPPQGEGPLRSRIEEALHRDPQLRGLHIAVETEEGLVRLRGRVHSLAERDEAEHVAWAAPGVRGVTDDALEVRP